MTNPSTSLRAGDERQTTNDQIAPGMVLPPIEYRLNLGNWQPFTMPFTITTEGDNLVQIRPAEVVNGPFGMQAYRVRSVSATDEEILSFLVRIDKSQPTLTITTPQPITYTHGTTFTLDYQAAEICTQKVVLGGIVIQLASSDRRGMTEQSKRGGQNG